MRIAYLCSLVLGVSISSHMLSMHRSLRQHITYARSCLKDVLRETFLIGTKMKWELQKIAPTWGVRVHEAKVTGIDYPNNQITRALINYELCAIKGEAIIEGRK